jgi:hypothetical protein
LTASGRAQATRIFAGHKRAMDSAARGLSEDERATLIRLLKKVGTSVEERRTTNIGERNHAVASDSQSRP